MKSSKTQTHSRVHLIPPLRFEPAQQLTSYAGLVVFMALFQRLRLKERLRRCFGHVGLQPIYGLHTVMLLLVVHVLLGFRRLRGLDYYRHDPLVARVVGLRKLPDVSTVSRALAMADARSVEQTRQLSRELVADRLRLEHFKRVTLDFDGSIQSTTGHAEGTAVGYNKVKKGARSYFPLFCTVAQTGQFWDLHHRPGNAHDSNGAWQFLLKCVARVLETLPQAVIEARMDAAFFNERMICLQNALQMEFTCSVPFERFAELKGRIQACKTWHVIDEQWSYFEEDWRPQTWSKRFRFIFLRQRLRKQRKGPLQLSLFEPIDHEFQYKVIVTNKTQQAPTVLLFHNGRGSQEKILGEAKQHAALDLIATRGLCGNQLFTLAGMVAHNLSRELQMAAAPPQSSLRPKRPTRWQFLQLGTLRMRLLHLAGRLIRPAGQLSLIVSDNPLLQEELLHYLHATRHPAAA